MSVERIAEVGQAIKGALSQIIVGQNAVIEHLVIALLAGGHVLLEGPPGTAKTLMVHAMARAVSGRFSRIQFTPDLLPADVLGTYVLKPGAGQFSLHKGPIFTDLLLADEINRAPPRTQAALLEAMQEGQVTLDGHIHPLSEGGFFVAATQNSVEFEGTYPLPEAQLDRFLFKLEVPYPTLEEEVDLLDKIRCGANPTDFSQVLKEPVTSLRELVALRASLSQIVASRDVLVYIAQLVRGTRHLPAVAVGAGPRASIALLLAARARAALHGRGFVNPDDIRQLAGAVLRHRIILDMNAEVDGIGPARVIDDLLNGVEVPR